MSPTPSTPAAERHRRLAARVAAAHQDLGDARLTRFVSGSKVENLVDERSDVDMSVVLQALPEATRLQACVHAAGGGVLKAEPPVNEAVLLAWQARLAVFPPELTLAMARHALKTPTHWRAAAQIVHRDTALLADRIDTLLAAPPRDAFAELHALEL